MIATTYGQPGTLNGVGGGSMGHIEQRIQELGLELPRQRPGKSKSLLGAKQYGNLLFVSGHGPEVEGKPLITGRVGAELSLEEGYEAARLCALNCLATLKTILGDLDRIDEIIKVLGFVNSAPDFHNQPAVMNGFSDTLANIFGERGKHARSAIGTHNLPNNQAVEVELIVSIKSV